jgi:Glu-tRNA(Gln) amidotransferase subunit E-like FAD-binding protein
LEVSAFRSQSEPSKQSSQHLSVKVQNNYHLSDQGLEKVCNKNMFESLQIIKELHMKTVQTFQVVQKILQRLLKSVERDVKRLLKTMIPNTFYVIEEVEEEDFKCSILQPSEPPKT